MTKKIFISIFLYLNIFLSIEAIDDKADQLIVECLLSENFSNTLINYQFYDKTYPIRIIHNPHQEYLMSDKEDFSEPISAALIAIGGLDVPVEVIWHLQKLLKNFTDKYQNSVIKLRSVFENQNKYAYLKPVFIATTIDDPFNIAILTRILSSNVFVNEVIYYKLDNNYYRARILYNPQKSQFKSEKKYLLRPFDPPVETSLTWNQKYAIAIDKKAPQDLVNYLSQCLICSPQEIYNGTKVKYKHESYSTSMFEFIYEIDTYFNWMGDFVLKSEVTKNKGEE